MTRRSRTLWACLVVALAGGLDFVGSASSAVALWFPVTGFVLLAYGGWQVACSGGLLDRWRWRSRARRVELRKEPAWLVDHSWNPLGDVRRGPSCRRLVDGLLFLALAGVGVGFISHRAKVYWPVGVWGAAFTVLCFRIWSIWGRGDVLVSFSKFPFHPGEAASIHVGLSPRGPIVDGAHYVLRRIDEHAGVIENGIAWKVTHVVNPRLEGDSLPSEHADVRLVFDLPEDAGGTCLSAPFPSYWQLEVALWTTSGFVLERFLVPIYERPRAVEAQAADVAVAEPTR